MPTTPFLYAERLNIAGLCNIEGLCNISVLCWVVILRTITRKSFHKFSETPFPISSSPGTQLARPCPFYINQLSIIFSLLLKRFDKFHNILLALQKRSKFLRVYVRNGTGARRHSDGSLHGFATPHGQPDLYQEEKPKVSSDDSGSDYSMFCDWIMNILFVFGA